MYTINEIDLRNLFLINYPSVKWKGKSFTKNRFHDGYDYKEQAETTTVQTYSNMSNVLWKIAKKTVRIYLQNI